MIRRISVADGVMKKVPVPHLSTITVYQESL